MPSTTTTTPVVLYACTTSDGNAEAVLTELRRHAQSHGWYVVGEFADRTGATSEDRRPGFLKAKQMLADGVASGILTRYPAMAAYLPVEQQRFTDWLRRHGAFAHYTWTDEHAQQPN